MKLLQIFRAVFFCGRESDSAINEYDGFHGTSQDLNKFAILMTSYSVEDCKIKMGLNTIEFLAYAP